MAYKDYLNNISRQAQLFYESILATYNIDYGDEYEIAVCKFLKLILPKRYSVCRGHIVAFDDTTSKGDDIIIYDNTSFPKVRLYEDDLSIKQYIPLEAVYAYIELKHTLYIENNFTTAIEQIADAKNLELKRNRRDLTQIRDRSNNLGNIALTAGINKCLYWPEYRNPMFGCIISRFIKFSESNKRDVTKKEINDFIANSDSNLLPDLIIAGNNFLCLPVIKKDKKAILNSPFVKKGESQLVTIEDNNSIGIGIINLLRALEFIELDGVKLLELMIGEIGNRVV